MPEAPTTSPTSGGTTSAEATGQTENRDRAAPIRCEYAGIYCGALGILERENAGRRELCCRHYLYGFSAGEAT